MIESISSSHNTKIKLLQTLRSHKGRLTYGQYIIDGLRETTRLLDHTHKANALFFCESLIPKNKLNWIQMLNQKANIPCFSLSIDLFKKVSYGNREDGILAIADCFSTTLTTQQVPESSLFVILEHIEKPGNLGAILRSADGAGINGVLITTTDIDIFNPNVIRASQGALFTVPIAVTSNTAALQWAQHNNIILFAATPHAKNSLYQANFKGKTAILFGNEANGLSSFWNQPIQQQITIPMLGKMDSLNLSTAVGITLYEALRQRNYSSKSESDSVSSTS